jgi:hypothetical protein
MTQTVILTQPVRVSGSVLAAGTTQTLARDIAADLVRRGFATPVGTPVWQSTAQSVARVIAQSNIPFLIMPGDGGANGCSFSGTAGAFTLSAAILANIYVALTGCYAYFSANFGGSTLPDGWYWTKRENYGNHERGIGNKRTPIARWSIGKKWGAIRLAASDCINQRQ